MTTVAKLPRPPVRRKLLTRPDAHPALWHTSDSLARSRLRFAEPLCDGRCCDWHPPCVDSTLQLQPIEAAGGEPAVRRRSGPSG